MRIMPACLYAYEKVLQKEWTQKQALECIHQISALTHNHLRSKMACGIYYFMVKNIIEGNQSLLERLQNGVDEAKTEAFIALVGTYGEPRRAMEKLSALVLCDEAKKALGELREVIEALDASGELAGVNVDFSVTSDMNYYSGIVFRGFIEGIPDGVLSGGSYDKLMKKMGRRARAIGFAVYLDLLARLDTRKKEYDADILLLYGEDASAGEVLRAVSMLSGKGRRVLAAKARPENIRCRELVIYRNGGFEILEKND